MSVVQLGPAAMDGGRWSDLPADVLREISARVCAAADFVYFHAVCKPWRSSRDLLSQATTTTQFRPWLLAPAENESDNLKFRCVFSKTSYHGTPALPVPRRNWVCSADGTAVWYLTVESLRPSLHDPLTGEVTKLPFFLQSQWVQENPRGIIYKDGSTFLYGISKLWDHTVRFSAALLRHGDAKWTVVERNLWTPNYNAYCAVYHGGQNIMFTVDGRLWHGIAPDGGDMLVEELILPRCKHDHGYYPPLYQYSYVLESREELLWVLVQVRIHHHQHYRHHKMSLFVHALEHDCLAPEKRMRWVRKDGHSLADRVLFLGYPNSFALDAPPGGGHGACAYFVYYGRKVLLHEQLGVFRYDLVMDKAEFVERLPQGWVNERCTWFVPQPVVAPIKELGESTFQAQELNKQHGPMQTNPLTSSTRIMRRHEPYFTVLVRRLPLTMDSSELRLFFSKHGKVCNAQVLYFRKTKRSQGIGHVTMSTQHAHQQDALDALNALFLDGRNLKVSFINNGHQ